MWKIYIIVVWGGELFGNLEATKDATQLVIIEFTTLAPQAATM